MADPLETPHQTPNLHPDAETFRIYCSWIRVYAIKDYSGGLKATLPAIFSRLLFSLDCPQPQLKK